MPELQTLSLTLENIVGGGQAIGTIDDGRKAFVWGGLPGETVEIVVTKKKSRYVEGYVTAVITPCKERVTPRDVDSYISTSPWQIMNFETEQRYKQQLLQEAFALHHVTLPNKTAIYSDNNTERYRNKVEFSWYGHVDSAGIEQLSLAFFRRGSKGKITISDSSLLPSTMIELARLIRDGLHACGVSARQLKTLLIRANQNDACVWQLYVKERDSDWQSVLDSLVASTSQKLGIGGEIIFSDPKSPASKVTQRLASFGNTVLEDTILGVPFRYATEGFFQVNIPVYEQALRDMQQWIPEGAATIDLYSGVGTIGLTIGGGGCTLVEINENAVREMRENIERLGSRATAVLAASEEALDYITGDEIVIVDPPRAGLHPDVIRQLLDTKPRRIIYLSCNPVTQARDVELLLETYRIVHTQGYNFFPRTPHIEHLVVLDV